MPPVIPWKAIKGIFDGIIFIAFQVAVLFTATQLKPVESHSGFHCPFAAVGM